MDEPIEVTLQNIFCLLVEKKKIDQLFGLIEKNLIIHSTITTIKKNDQQQKCSLDILMVFISMICDGNQQIARVFLQKHFFRSLTTRLIPFLTKKIVFDHQNPRGYRKLLDMNMNMNMDSGRKRPTTAMAASKTTTTFPIFERCMYHQVWCLLLRLVGETLGLLGDPMVADVLDFVCHSEKIFVSAMELPFNNYNVPSLEPSEQQEEQKLTLALMEERQSIVHVLIALSDFQIQWRQRMPNGFVFFIEKTRQLFKNSCLFLSNGTSFSHQTRLFEHTKAISEEEKRLCCLYPKQQDQDEDIVKPIATATVSTATSEKLDKEPRTPSPKSKSTRLSSSSFSSSSLMKMTASPIVSESKQHFSMRKQSSSIHDDRRTKPIHAVFYDVMEKNLLKFVFEASTLFLKLTPPIQTVIVIDGVTHIDEEASYPIFDFIPPTQCNFMTPPSLGHLCLAMVSVSTLIKVI
jgi:hypothetical protein